MVPDYPALHTIDAFLHMRQEVRASRIDADHAGASPSPPGPVSPGSGVPVRACSSSRAANRGAASRQNMVVPGGVPRRMNGMHRRSSCPPSYFLDHETDGRGIAKVVMPLAAHPFNMVVGHFVD